jgi:hypothetical protein
MPVQQQKPLSTGKPIVAISDSISGFDWYADVKDFFFEPAVNDNITVTPLQFQENLVALNPPISADIVAQQVSASILRYVTLKQMYEGGASNSFLLLNISSDYLYTFTLDMSAISTVLDELSSLGNLPSNVYVNFIQENPFE